MSKNVILKQDGQFSSIYIKNAKVYYAKVYEPQDKYKGEEGEREFSVQLFIDEQSKEALLDLPVNSAKVFAEVGVDKLKKGPNRGKFKYPTEKYPDCEGLFGFGLSCPEFSKKGKPRFVKVINKKGEDIDDLIGNGSTVTVKCSAYQNQDGEWNMQLNLVQVLDLIPYESSGEIEDDVLGVTYSAGNSKKRDDIDPELAVDDDEVPQFDTEDEADDDEY